MDFSHSRAQKNRSRGPMKPGEHPTHGTVRRASAARALLGEGPVWVARDLVNEPLSFLTATQLSAEFRNLSRNAGFKVQVLHKDQIEALGMGGLIAVNKGSPDPPTFTVMEWKPKDAVNEEPVLLVGKGVVYDTGGLSLKPTPNSMTGHSTRTRPQRRRSYSAARSSSGVPASTTAAESIPGLETK